jgi:cell division septum initiation protein DivIVA
VRAPGRRGAGEHGSMGWRVLMLRHPSIDFCPCRYQMEEQQLRMDVDQLKKALAKAEQEKALAEKALAKAEQEKVEALAKAEQEKVEALAKAEQEKVEAVAKAEQEKALAEKAVAKAEQEKVEAEQGTRNALTTVRVLRYELMLRNRCAVVHRRYMQARF